MPKRFQFRLDPLLHLRASLEKESERALARALQAEREAEAHLEMLKRQREEAVLSKRTGAGSLVDLDRWRAIERYLVALERLSLRAEAALAEAQTASEACRESLRKARRDRLSLERLKERRRDQHTQEQLRMEANQMDELAVLRHGRSQ